MQSASHGAFWWRRALNRGTFMRLAIAASPVPPRMGALSSMTRSAISGLFLRLEMLRSRVQTRESYHRPPVSGRIHLLLSALLLARPQHWWRFPTALRSNNRKTLFHKPTVLPQLVCCRGSWRILLNKRPLRELHLQGSPRNSRSRCLLRPTAPRQESQQVPPTPSFECSAITQSASHGAFWWKRASNRRNFMKLVTAASRVPLRMAVSSSMTRSAISGLYSPREAFRARGWPRESYYRSLLRGRIHLLLTALLQARPQQ